ncbi:MAG TPA: OsmC family protein [Cytophagaceae bacterium]|jgi:putative redox protein|nr:OsmC family protein [Cytophagaceae bacterium]
MVINLVKQEGAYHFQAANESGSTINIDASPAIGGTNQGPRPMELLIMGLGGCSGIDILSILRKQKIEPEAFSIHIEAEREKDATPSLFTDIHVRFVIKGDIDPGKIERAAQLSMDKYCSVAKTLEKTAKITYSVVIEK